MIWFCPPMEADQEVARQQQEQARALSALLTALQTMLAAIRTMAEVQERQAKELARFRSEADQRMAELAAALAKLAETQRQAEERLARLEEAQVRTEERVARLEEAQVRIQEELRALTAEVRQLVRAQKAMRDQLNRFGSIVGIVAEERMAICMERWLESRGYQILMPISSLPLNSETELDGITQVRDSEGNVEWVLISVRGRAHPRDFEEFAGILSRERVRALLRKRGIQGRIRPIIFGLTMHWDAAEAARQHRIGLVLSERGEMAPAGLWEL